MPAAVSIWKRRPRKDLAPVGLCSSPLVIESPVSRMVSGREAVPVVLGTLTTGGADGFGAGASGAKAAGGGEAGAGETGTEEPGAEEPGTEEPGAEEPGGTASD